MVAAQRVNFSGGWKLRCEIFREPVVHVLFGRKTNMKRRSPSRPPNSPPAVESASGPTEERYRHGKVERLDRPIADDAGRSARPYRAVDTLAMMERRGSITSGMRQAAEDFRLRFVKAHLDPLRALDYSRPRDGGTGRARGGGVEAGLPIENARDHVWRAIVAVGGPSSTGGSCLWHVVGWERSLKEWAIEQGWNGRRVSQEAASGILIATLGILDAHYHHVIAKK
jgi:hypothetical protein